MSHSQLTARVPAIALLLLVILSLSGCDKIVPPKFKAQDFAAAPIDLRAGATMTRDTINNSLGYTIAHEFEPLFDSTGVFNPDTVGRVLPISWLTVNSRTLSSFGLQGATDNQVIAANFDMLADSLQPLVKDSLLLVSYAAGERVNYSLIRSTASEDVYIYTGLQYYYSQGSSNINEYVTVDLLRKDTSLVASTWAVQAQSAYSSTEVLLYANGPKTISVVSSRYKVHLEQGVTYLVRFTLSNPLLVSNPQSQPNPLKYSLPVIRNHFKIVVLSAQ